VTGRALRGDASRFRARRWDVVVLGGALPGLAAAVRLARARLRVLVVEEEAAARTAAPLREPWMLPDTASGGLGDEILRAVGLSPIERRDLGADPVTCQVLSPDARIDVVDPATTASELAAFGLAPVDEAAGMLRELADAARAEGDALGETDLLRKSGLRGLALGAPGGGRRHVRGFPERAAHATGALAHWLLVLEDALSGRAGGAGSPEARARLLGAALLPGAVGPGPAGGLRSLLARRLETLHVEMRTVGCPFELVELHGQPGILRHGPGDAWLGRVLMVNAPLGRLTAAQRSWGVEMPRALEAEPATVRRLRVPFRALREVLPEALSSRAVVVPDKPAPGGVARAFRLSVQPSRRGRPFAELVAAVRAPDEPGLEEPLAAWVEEGLRGLLPFSERGLVATPRPDRPLWDDDEAEAGADAPCGWPGTVDARPAKDLWVLRREPLAGLGAEGDLLLGLRAGDAVAAALT
jgi:hypothetical protein